MNKKFLIGILMFVVVLLAVFVILIPKPHSTKELFEQRFSEFKIQYEEQKKQSYDVTEAEVFARQAKYAYNMGDYAKANTLLDDAFEDLENLEKAELILITSIKVETACTDGIDNDGDGLIDNDDGDCWIREGAVFMANYHRLISFNDYGDMIPELKETGITTIEMLPIWEHCHSDNIAQRFAVRNFSKLDPIRGTEDELKVFLDKAHDYGLKVVTYMNEGDTGISSTPECGWYDIDGIGGALYQYQMQNPDKNILARNKNGDFVCSLGYGYAVNLESEDVIEFFKIVYKQLQDYGFDGQRLDAPARKTCTEQEIVYPWTCEGKLCPNPIEEKITTIDYYRELVKLKKPNEIFIAEHPTINAIRSNWFCSYPYYPPDTMVDEVAEASETPLFDILLLHHIVNNKSSSQLIEWITDEPISYNRQRFRYVITWTRLRDEAARFIVTDPRYFPSVALVSTIPGIPKVTDYELFGSKDADKHFRANGDSEKTSGIRRNHWKNILGIRNHNNALKYGSISNVWKSGDNTYAYLREYEDEQVIVVINFLDKEATSYLDLSFLHKETVLYDELSGETFTVTNLSNFKISVPAYGSRILVLERGK